MGAAPQISLQDLSAKLARIAATPASDGADSFIPICRPTQQQPHLLDTVAEVYEARNLVLQAIESRAGLSDDTSEAELEILKKAGEQLSQLQSTLEGYPQGQFNSLQVNPVFYDVLDYRISKGPSFVGADLLVPLGETAFISLDVYSGGGGRDFSTLHRVSLTRSQWDFIVAPLNQANIPICPEPSAGREREFLAESIARAESTLGPLAGTDSDIGGLRGNRHMETLSPFSSWPSPLDGYSLDQGILGRAAQRQELTQKLNRVNDNSATLAGQQDCINEMQTTRALISTLSNHGFLHFHSMDNNFLKIILDNRIVHVAAKLHEPGTGCFFAVDSWVNDNGDLPEIMPGEKWGSYWIPIFEQENTGNTNVKPEMALKTNPHGL